MNPPLPPGAMPGMSPGAPSGATAQTPEHVYATTAFGTVSNKRITLYAKKFLLGTKTEEDLLLRHVTAVRLERVRHWIWGVLLLAVGLLTIKIGVGILFLVLALMLFWGWPRVAVNTAGGDLRYSVGMPWTSSEAETFVATLRQQLLNRE